MESISFFERGLRGERNQTLPYMLSAKQETIWYHFYIVFGMTRSVIEPGHDLTLTGRTFYQLATDISSSLWSSRLILAIDLYIKWKMWLSKRKCIIYKKNFRFQ